MCTFYAQIPSCSPSGACCASAAYIVSVVVVFPPVHQLLGFKRNVSLDLAQCGPEIKRQIIGFK